MKSYHNILFLVLFTNIVSAQTFDERYRQFQQQARQEYSDFRDAANERYAEFLRSAWEYYKIAPAIPQPKEDEVPPVVYDDEQEKENKEQGRDGDPVPYEDVVPQPEPTPQPQPISPVIEHNEHETRLSVSFYGLELMFRYPKQGFSLSDISGETLANAWQELSSDRYDNLLYDCLSAREGLRLCDWAYLSLLQAVGEQACGEGNAAVFLEAFLYVQSGYQMRLAVHEKQLYMLVGTDYILYDRGYFTLDGSKFFPLVDISEVAEGMQICSGAFEQEQPFSLQIPQEQKLAQLPSSNITRTAQSRLSVTCSVNRNLIDFYNRYPTGHYGEDFSNRWATYANTPLDEKIQQQLYPGFRQAIRGVPELQAVSLLLNWVQTAFEYEYDDKVWGGDRAFFPAESLYYPYCDCEDRSILFSRIVRDLLGLDVVLLYYPGHLATAVCFNQPVRGDYLDIKGKRYVVCDPTYIGAPVGATMPDMDNSTAKVIMLAR